MTEQPDLALRVQPGDYVFIWQSNNDWTYSLVEKVYGDESLKKGSVKFKINEEPYRCKTLTLEQLPRYLKFLRASNKMMTTDPDPMKATPTEEISTESNNATTQFNDASASTPASATASDSVSSPDSAPVFASTTVSAPVPALTSVPATDLAPESSQLPGRSIASEHRVGPGIPLLPNSFEETEWLVPPRDDTARLKARHAYDQWKQEAISLSSHDPHASSGGRSIFHPGRVNGSAAKKLVSNCNRVTLNAPTTPASITNQWVVKPKGDRARKKASAVKLKANSDYRNKYSSPEGSDAQFPRTPKSSKAPRFKDTKWVVRPKGNSAWKKARLSFSQRKKTNPRFDRDNTFQLIRQRNKHGRCWGSPSGAPRPTAK